MNLQKGGLMNINKILVTGHPQSGYGSVANVLNSGGMYSANPSRREGMTPSEISDALLQAHQHGSAGILPGSGEIRQLDISPVWNGLALDLMLGNIEQKFWCWADTKAVSLLDYWKSLDTQLAFVLVYETPQDLIAHAFNETDTLTPDVLEARLEEWSAYNKTLLRFYHRNAERSLLVHASQIRENGATFLQHVRSQTGLPLIAEAGDIAEVASTIPSSESALYRHLAEAFLEQQPDAMQLYAELQSVADLPMDDSQTEKISVSEILTAAIKMKSKYGQELLTADEEVKALELENRMLSEKLLKAHREGEEQADENGLLLSHLHEVQEQLEQLHIQSRKQIAELNENIARMTKERDEHATEAVSLNQAMELLKKEKAEQQKAVTEKQNQIEQLSKENQTKQKVLDEKNAQLSTLKAQNDQTKIEKDAALQKLKEAEEVKSENELLLAQLHIVQEELEQYYLENTKLKKEEQKRKAKPYGAAERVKNQLSYRLGAKMIENSRSFGGWVSMPAALVRETRQFRRDFAKRAGQKLPPISHYADAHDAERVKKHLSYRLGRVMVEKSRSPIGLVTLPLALRRAVKEYRRDRANV